MRSLSKDVYRRLAGLGAAPDDTEDVRLQKMLMVISVLLIIPAGAAWSASYVLLDEPRAALVPAGYVVLSSLSIGVFSFTRNFAFFRFNQLLLILLLPWLLMLVLGGFVNSSAVILWSLLCPVGALLFAERRQALLWFAAYVALVLAGLVLQPYLRSTNNLPDIAVQALFVMNIGSVSLIAFVLLHYFVGQKSILQEKTENLLLNILPKEIAAILKNESRTIADHYEGASILFADMVDFTVISAEMNAAETVNLLNEIFSYFDMLVEKHGLEKIKTIGDCYMVAAGIPRPRPDHARALTRLALDMRAYIKGRRFETRRAVDFRIGLNSGPVLAGVIGRKKFIYDLWGDAVNTASRMESQGAGGIIQISRGTYELIKDDFDCEPRGTIDVKGKGAMEVWSVVGERRRAA